MLDAQIKMDSIINIDKFLFFNSNPNWSDNGFSSDTARRVDHDHMHKSKWIRYDYLVDTRVPRAYL